MRRTVEGVRESREHQCLHAKRKRVEMQEQTRRLQAMVGKAVGATGAAGAIPEQGQGPRDRQVGRGWQPGAVGGYKPHDPHGVRG